MKLLHKGMLLLVVGCLLYGFFNLPRGEKAVENMSANELIRYSASAMDVGANAFIGAIKDSGAAAKSREALLDIAMERLQDPADKNELLMLCIEIALDGKEDEALRNKAIAALARTTGNKAQEYAKKLLDIACEPTTSATVREAALKALAEIDNGKYADDVVELRKRIP